VTPTPSLIKSINYNKSKLMAQFWTLLKLLKFLQLIGAYILLTFLCSDIHIQFKYVNFTF